MLHEQALDTADKVTAAPPPPDFNGRWVNQMASVMDLTVSGSKVSGTYSSASSSGGGPIDGSVNGVTVGDLIAFNVFWENSGSITAWTGQLVEDGGITKLRTLWHLVTNVPDSQEPTKFWMSTMAGADEFTR